MAKKKIRQQRITKADLKVEIARLIDAIVSHDGHLTARDLARLAEVGVHIEDVAGTPMSETMTKETGGRG